MLTPSMASGVLYLVATPIGNREDITLRAIRILKTVDWIAAEDTRHSGLLLKHLEIRTPLISYHRHNQAQRIPELLQRLQAGQSVALISDAGMPAISDPGEEMVQACLTSGISVVPIPGATAAITALAASGLPTERFAFEGFLPTQTAARRERLSRLAQEERTLIVYEAPHRLPRTLQDLAISLGEDRQVSVGRELTKHYEEFWRGSLGSALAHYQSQPIRGEFTLVIAGGKTTTATASIDDLKQELQHLLEEGVSLSQASRQVAKHRHQSRHQVYQLALQLLASQPGSEDA
ncbi:MAG: 16S rRNA (cytidine(1402)-2'-O)-methyltransferase [Cyanobacteriota bacterium]|nr:16S rRNA (cytidine(1402)-2'-O)-methyltransferase [Cyanobacteriota bacterium]